MKIYKIIAYNSNVVINHGYFDFIECQSKLLNLTFKDNISKIEIVFDSVKTHTKKSNDEK